jgi:hypothetical protein
MTARLADSHPTSSRINGYRGRICLCGPTHASFEIPRPHDVLVAFARPPRGDDPSLVRGHLNCVGTTHWRLNRHLREPGLKIDQGDRLRQGDHS